MPYKIKLPCGRETLVDKDIFERFGHLAWYADWKRTQWQIMCGFPLPTGGQKKVALARLVLPPIPGHSTDHKNRDTFDNRRRNLRHATRAEQRANTAPSKGRIFKGVFKDGEKWRAQIRFAGKVIYLGLFASAIEAAQAYNKKAKEFYGNFAWLNPV